MIIIFNDLLPQQWSGTVTYFIRWSSFQIAEFTKECSAQWKVLSDRDRHQFESLAAKDKERYDREVWSCIHFEWMLHKMLKESIWCCHEFDDWYKSIGNSYRKHIAEVTLEEKHQITKHTHFSTSVLMFEFNYFEGWFFGFFF